MTGTAIYAAGAVCWRVIDGRIHPTIAPFDAERFAEGRLIREGSLVVPGEVTS